MFLRRVVYGTNEIVIKQRSLLTIFVVEILNPFFVFQLFSFAVWCLDEYILYATTIMIMTITSVILSGYSTYKVSAVVITLVVVSIFIHWIINVHRVESAGFAPAGMLEWRGSCDSRKRASFRSYRTISSWWYYRTSYAGLRHVLRCGFAQRQLYC